MSPPTEHKSGTTLFINKIKDVWVAMITTIQPNGALHRHWARQGGLEDRNDTIFLVIW